jgi:hypothetical protein
MNWLVIAVVGAAAAWFEFNYQRSRHSQKRAAANASNPPVGTPALDATSSHLAPVPETAHVAEAGNEPSIAPGDENDKKLNSPTPEAGSLKAYSTHAQM